jgi:Fe-S-cluster-containing hydrogenase component 2|uniref:4Fe-4S ferredoxin n=1 Tax=candidate division WOR-3 bacterium TaxID=2052148 RepID=A0A7C3UYC3_UNCW3
MIKSANFRKTGVITEKELRRLSLLPPRERLEKGPCVILECVEKIPCNPCVYACPRKAIKIEGSIIEIPKVDFSRCIGCLLCIPKCPGLCIFVVHKNYTRDSALVSIPYEFLINFREGEEVIALNRAGEEVCEGEIEKVISKPSFDHCAIVQIKVPKRYWNEVRGFKKKERK